MEMVCDVVWDEIENGLKQMVDYEEVTLIGSEVTLIIYLKCQVQCKKSLCPIYMTSQYSFLNSLTYEKRIAELGLNPDRADILFPPLESISMQ
jgi:exopolyphosphatase/guanosine-5'-triphosphate,3'-diphosphate pyrophosphatase